MENKIYNRNFYEKRDEKTYISARKIIGMLKAYFDVKSVIDFGCGVGTWLKVCKEEFGNDILVKGMDGDYVQREFLQIADNEFFPTDLSKKVSLDKRYDLAISLEVAEHLPPERAIGFVEDLCTASDVVLFSGATKYQGGDGHINEQRLSYWVEKFEMQGYVFVDYIRPNVWNDEDVISWYKQNVALFINRARTDVLIDEMNAKRIVDAIHPDVYEQYSRIVHHPLVQGMYKLYALKSLLGKR